MIIRLLLLLTLTLTGCAENMDYQYYTAALADDSENDTEMVVAQSAAIATALATSQEGATKTEKILLAVIAMDRINSLTSTPLHIEKPVGGYDVLDKHTGTIVGSIVTGALGYWSYDAIKSVAITAGGTNNYNNGGAVTTEGSNNYVELHQTGSDSSSMGYTTDASSSTEIP